MLKKKKHQIIGQLKYPLHKIRVQLETNLDSWLNFFPASTLNAMFLKNET